MKLLKKSRTLLVVLAVPLLLALLLLLQLQHARATGTDVAEAPAGFELRWEDDFESYAPGSTYTTGFPSPPYIHSGLKDMFVYTDTYQSPNQSLKGQGIVGGCGSSIAYRPINGGSPIEIEFWVQNGYLSSTPLSGCHPFYGGIELSTEPSYTGNHRGLLGFFYDDSGQGSPYKVYGGGLEVDEPYPGESLLYLQDFSLHTWYKVKVRYEVINQNEVQLTYWIDDQQVGQQTLGTRPYEGALQYLGLFVGERVAWFDDVSVYAADGPVDLSLSMWASDYVVAPGGNVQYHLSVQNEGPVGDASGVMVVDDLPAGATFVDATTTQGTCQENSGTLTCNLGDMALNATVAITVNVTAPGSDTFLVNAGTVVATLNDPAPNNNNAQVGVLVDGNPENVYLPLIRLSAQ